MYMYMYKKCKRINKILVAPAGSGALDGGAAHDSLVSPPSGSLFLLSFCLPFLPPVGAFVRYIEARISRFFLGVTDDEQQKKNT